MKTIACSLFMAFILFTRVVDAADDWTQKFPSPKPSGRIQHDMAYANGDQVLMFGGYDGNL